MVKPADEPLTLDLSQVDWSAVSDLVCRVLTTSLQARDRLVREWAEEEASFEQIAAMSMTQMLSEHFQKEAGRQAGKRRRKP